MEINSGDVEFNKNFGWKN